MEEPNDQPLFIQTFIFEEIAPKQKGWQKLMVEITNSFGYSICNE